MPGKRAVAEFVGTFVLVFGGVGTAVIAGNGVGTLGISFAFGLSLLVMAYAIGPISGCHINPAVTTGLVVSRRMTVQEAIPYWIAQALGAIVAAFFLFIVVKAAPGAYDMTENGFGANGYGDHSPGGYGLGAAAIVEIILTGLLVFTVLAATDRLAETAFAGIPIGLVLTLIHLVSIPVTNTSVNPARSLGPAVFAGSDAILQLWLFILAPVLGGVAGALLYARVFEEHVPVPLEEATSG